MRAFVALLCLVTAWAQPGWAQEDFRGVWVGGFESGGQRTSLRGSLLADDGSPSLALDIQATSGPTRLEGELALAGAEVRIDGVLAGDRIRFTGRRAGRSISGRFEYQGQTGLWELIQTQPSNGDLFRELAGSYALADGNYLSIGEQSRDGVNLRLSYVERASGRRGVLTPLSDLEFAGGPGLGVDYPFVVRVRFERAADGAISGLTLRYGEGQPQTAQKIQLVREEVSFVSDGAVLAGTLVRPARGSRVPAVVLAHGSTPLMRFYFGADPYMYPAEGVAVLFYDKRGVAGSTGRRTESIEQLADDAVAAMRYLAGRPEIDPQRIGVFGHSQGGWVAPEAVRRSRGLAAFLVAGSASGLSVQDNQAFEIAGDLRVAGFSEADQGNAVALFRQGNSVIAAGGEGWNEWRAAAQRAQAEPWFRLARTPRSIPERNPESEPRVQEMVQSWRSEFYDPIPAWRSVGIPTLVYESEWDRDVPSRESARLISGALAQAGNRDYTVHVFPRSNHGQWAMEENDPNSLLSHRVHYDLLFGWLRARVTDGSRVEQP